MTLPSGADLEAYIEISHRLPEHKFEVGDWVYDELFDKVAVVTYWDGYHFAETRYLDGKKGTTQKVVWLPQSPVQWMEMKEWNPDYKLQVGRRWWMIKFETEEGSMVVSCGDDPLLACAKAWARAREAES